MAGLIVAAERSLGLRSTPLECLADMDGIKVKENMRALEVATALMGTEFEMPNCYQVFRAGGKMWHGWDDKFYGAEQSNMCLRNLKQCFGDCTAWSLNIYYREGVNVKDQLAFKMERPCTLTCCCFMRPKAYMTMEEPGKPSRPIGSLRDPCDCSSTGLGIEIYDASDELAYTVDSGFCPMGYWCPLPWVPTFRDITMTIRDREKKECGKITKRVPSMFKFLIAPDVDDYHVVWPGVENPEHRALLMAATMFLDFRYFNDNSNDESGRKAAREAICGDGESSESDGENDWRCGESRQRGDDGGDVYYEDR